MRFSTAIKKGAKQRSQAFGWLLKDQRLDALGAGLLGGNLLSLRRKRRLRGTGDELERLGAYTNFPILSWRCGVLPCPCEYTALIEEGLEGADTYAAAIVHLNDTHRWKREKIAAWLLAEERFWDTIPEVDELGRRYSELSNGPELVAQVNRRSLPKLRVDIDRRAAA